MVTDGTPDFAAIRCGEEIARLRTKRKWSRAKLINRLLDELEPDDPNRDKIGETWLARLENGRMVKIHRQTIEALCRALQCTRQERAKVLLHADRNILSTPPSTPTPVEELLTSIVDILHVETKSILATLIGQRHVEDLDEEEILDITAAALDIVVKSRRS